MKIELTQVTIRDLVDGYADNSANEEGIVGYGGRLNIRPKYQREFVYDDKKRNAVMDTVWKGFPLNVMYWVRNDDGNFELLDGQQRTISICQYVWGEYMMHLDNDLRGFENLSKEQKDRILDYELQIYICEGTADEQLDWFRIINIAGEKLTDQELRNAIYSGPWVTQAKRRFSKTRCVAWQLGCDYMSGTPIRQDYLETVLRWMSDKKIEEYMAKHQPDANAVQLWNHFSNVINWVKAVFPKYRKEMKGSDWGRLYAQHKDRVLDPNALEMQVAKLMQDSDVQRKRGIYEYVLDGDERHLDLRAFDDNTKREVYERQLGVCPICGQHFEIEQMEADHITPWCDGGRTTADNCQMLCRDCNRHKSGK